MDNALLAAVDIVALAGTWGWLHERARRGAGVLLALLAASGAAAQIPTLQPGLRVRVLAPSISSRWFVGVLMTQTADTMGVGVAPGDVRPIPTHTIRRLQVSAGDSRVGWARALGVAGGVALFLDQKKLVGGQTPKSPADLAGAFIVGGLIGGAAGWLIGGEVWGPVNPRKNSPPVAGSRR